MFEDIKAKYSQNTNNSIPQPLLQSTGGYFGDIKSKYLGTQTSAANPEMNKLTQLAEAKGYTQPKEKKGALERIRNVLAYPSKKTEEFILKGGEKIGLTKGKTYEEALSNIGVEQKKDKLDTNDVLSFALRIVLDPLNLVAPLKVGEKVLSGVKVGVGLAKNIEPVAKVLQTAEELFIPMVKAGRVSPQFAEEITTLATKIGSKQERVVENTAKLFKQFSPEIRTNIGKLIETAGKGGKLADDEAKAVKLATDFIKKNITDPEIQAKIAPNIIANYFPRKVDREAVSNMLKFGGKRLSLGLGGAEKARKFATQVVGEAAGIAYKEPVEALAIRASKSETARANVGFLQRLIGGDIKDITGNVLVKGVKEGIENGSRELAVKELKGFQAPVEIADELEKYFKTFTSDEATNALLKIYDKALGIWKGSVTSIFPAFHLRNAVGNVFNMNLGGFKDVTKFADAVQIQRGKEIVVKGVKVTKELLEDLGVMNRGQFGADIPEVISKTLGTEKLISKINPLKILGKGKEVGTVVENNARIAFFLDRLSKGDDVAKAVGQVKKYLFDYGALTPFERNVMKRVIPFYTWMRNNIPLQIENLITKPGKMSFFAKLPNIMQLSEEEKKVLPDFVKEGTYIPTERKDGELSVLSSLGLPYEDLGKLWRGDIKRTVQREGLGSMGPLGNLLGLASGKDFYRGKDIEELGYTYGRSSKNFPKAMKDLLDYREEKTKKGDTIYYVNPEKYYLLNIFGSRIFKTIARGIETGSVPKGILSSFAFWNKTPINMEEAKSAKESKDFKELEKFLIKKGVLKEFKKTYVPNILNNNKSQ